ncbi:MAG TPA: fused MFS/spermidine synthase [Casimicrobiaceae bacterium]|nr:fused MFS/spermidine synthase [Casimicrobiaceae bacterium]
MFFYAATIFVSAFLLFLVQPIIAKQILPWFGGAAAVWTTCLVFFQVTLLAGYAYSDLVVHRLRPRMQISVHIGLLALSLVLLPIIPASGWKPTGLENPSWRILALLAVTIGLPYFLLSTTSPLMQAWLARARPGSSPYRLFALSNLASLVALVGYPFLLEPWVATRGQAFGWSAGYVVFALLCAWTGWASLGRMQRLQVDAAVQSDGIAAAAAPTVARQLLWATLAGTASLLLLAVSNHIVQNIAAVPLLWIIPLAIYLLTFILCFDGRGWYRREVFLAMFAAGVSVMGWTLADQRLTFELTLQIIVFCSGLFLACMFCHGELVRLKPAPAHLTRFYLMVSLGGAAGSALVGIVAPLVLPADFELAGGLVLAALLLLWQVRQTPLVFPVLAFGAVVTTAGCAAWSINEFYDRTVVASRNFYGVLRVQLNGSTDTTYRRSLVHGTILHGTQFLAPELRQTPTSYYTQTSGIGRLFESLHPSVTPLKVGVIGLGAGTVAAWGAKDDVFRFYEINPDVLTIARRDFSYLQDSDAKIEVVIGDARLSLEREPSQQFDVLIIDAFSSDAIPVHLITAQALGIYRRHMKPGGVIAFHVTNRYLNLVPVVDGLATVHRLVMVHIADSPASPASSSDWLLLSDRRSSLDKPILTEAAKEVEVRKDWRLWTDDFNNLVQVLK